VVGGRQSAGRVLPGEYREAAPGAPMRDPPETIAPPLTPLSRKGRTDTKATPEPHMPNTRKRQRRTKRDGRGG